MNRKLLLGLGTVASIVSPVIVVVSCSQESHTLLSIDSVKKILSKHATKNRIATFEISNLGGITFQVVVKIYDFDKGTLIQQLNFDGETNGSNGAFYKSQTTLRKQIEQIWNDLMKEVKDE